MVPPLQVRASVRTLSEGIRYKIDTFSDVFAFNIFAPLLHAALLAHTRVVWNHPQQLYEIPTPGECGVCGWLGPGCGPYRTVLPVLLGLRRRGHQQGEGWFSVSTGRWQRCSCCCGNDEKAISSRICMVCGAAGFQGGIVSVFTSDPRVRVCVHGGEGGVMYVCCA